MSVLNVSFLLLSSILLILGANGEDEAGTVADVPFRNNLTEFFVNGTADHLLSLDEYESFNLDHIEQLMLDPLNRTKRQSLAALAGLNFGAGLGPFQQQQQQPQQQNVEGLLASCQLTNLLMYQLLQQKQQVAAGAQLNPQQQALGAINQNLVIPPMETLSTYVSTSTYVKTMTTTALVTIPLLFGNKPVPTTITRTKTYEVTTSDLITLTSTIRPMTTQMPAAALMSVAEINPTAAIVSPAAPSATATLAPTQDSENDDEESSRSEAREIQSSSPERSRSAGTTVEDEKKFTRRGNNNNGGRGEKRRKSRPAGSKIGSDNLHTNLGSALASKKDTTARSRDSAQYKILRDNRSRYETATTGAPPSRQSSRGNVPANNQYSPRNSPPQHQQQQENYRQQYQQPQQYQQQQQQYQSPQQAYRRPVVEVESDPEYVQYPDDYSYYARRLKRGQVRSGSDATGTGQAEDEEEQYPLEREYLLEPSFQEDFSQNYQSREKCPPVAAPPAAPVPAETVTVTQTKTITKWLNPSSQSSFTPALPSSAVESRNNNSRGRARYRSRSTTTTTEASNPQAEYFREQYNNGARTRRGRPRVRTDESPTR